MGNVVTDISQLDVTKQYTIKDYLSWRFTERVELFKGYIAKMSPAPSSRHQLVSGKLHLGIGLFLRKKTCKVFYAPYDVYLPTIDNKTVVQPDICVICDTTKIQKKGCVGSPDLVIEILSPGNSKREMQDKFYLYEEAGVKEYWLVYPSEQVIQVNFLENGKYVPQKAHANGDKVYTKVLEGLELEIDEIFEN
jgi:Uma2 family endonuclease